jgi:peptide/nickel transport system substrate-binding protein
MIVSKGEKVRRFMVILALTVCFSTSVYFLTESAVTAQDLVVNRKAEGISLDPAKTTTMEDYMVMGNIFSSLFRFKTDSFDLRPDLATEYRVSPDGKTYTFKLRQGVQWHKGYGEFTAEDVAFSINRVKNPETKSPYARNFANVAKVEVTGKYEVKMELKQPEATFLQNLTVTRPCSGLIVSKQAVTKLGNDHGSQPIGTGPFVFQEAVPREKIVLVANPDYYEGAPKLKRITFVPIADETTALMALESGDVHITQIENVRLLQKYQNHEKLNVITGPRISVHMILMNTKRPPFNNVKVRQAMAYAINTDEIINGILAGFADKPTGVIHPQMFGYTADVQKYPYDPQKAKNLLAEAGYPNGFKTKVVVLIYGQWQKVMELVKAQLAKVGIDMAIQMLERGAYVQARAQETTELVMFGVSLPPDPDFVMRDFHSKNAPPGGLNLSRYSGVDDLIEKGSQEMDKAKRSQIYGEIQRRMAQDVPAVVLYHPKWTQVVNKRVRGYTVERMGGFWLFPVSID